MLNYSVAELRLNYSVAELRMKINAVFDMLKVCRDGNF